MNMQSSKPNWVAMDSISFEKQLETKPNDRPSVIVKSGELGQVVIYDDHRPSNLSPGAYFGCEKTHTRALRSLPSPILFLLALLTPDVASTTRSLSFYS